MASFTDKIVEFNPYISQVPVDDYVRVGMYKQQQYDQGIAKVQNYIDSIRGLDVVKDVHKEYVNKALDNLRGEVGKVISADFSNNQLTNQIGSLTSRIVSDPIVQNAILSTQQYKKGIAEMQKARSEGKNGVENDWFFQKQADTWLSDGNSKTPFSGSYTQYRDVRKKALDIIKAVDPSSKLTQIPFVRNGDGTVALDQDGRPQIDQVMLESHTEGKDPETLRRALMAGLDESDINQLSIEGQYHFRDQDPVAMKGVVDTTYKARVADLDKMYTALQTEKMIKTNDKQRQAELDQQIANVKERGDNINKEYAQDIDNLSANPEGFKGGFYTDNYIDQIGKAFSSVKESFKYLDNPYQNQLNKDREFNLQYLKATHDMQIDEDKLQLERERLNKEKNKPGAAGLISIPITQDTPTDIPKPTEAGWQAAIEGQEKSIEQGKRDVIAKLFPSLVPEEAEKELLKLKDAWEKGDAIDDRAKEYFDYTSKAKIALDNKKQALITLQTEANKQFNTSEYTKNIPIQNVTSSSGTKYSFNGEDFANFYNKIKNIDYSLNPQQVVIDGASISARGFDEQEANRQFTTPKERFLYSIYKKQQEGKPVNEVERRLISTVNKVAVEIPEKITSTINKRNQFISEKLAPITKEYQPEQYGIDAGNTEKLYGVKNIFNAFLNNASNRGKSVGESPNFDFDEAMKAVNDEKSTFGVYRQGGNAFLTVQSGKTKAQYLPISNQQLNALYPDVFTRPFDPIQENIALSGSRASTNVRGMGAETAYFNKVDFPFVSKYGVKGDLEKTNGGGYQLRLYIHDPSTNRWIERTMKAIYDESNLLANLRNVGDVTIKELLEQK